jgi:broad specificity phosphatase PhoE
VLLLRHGRTGHNAHGRIQGQLDIGLDAVGQAQARAVADVLAEAQPHAVMSSDLARALDTARAVADRTGAPLTADARLRELDLGEWQGLTMEEARAAFPEQHAAWRAGEDVRRGGGETYREAGERAAACIREALVDVPDGGTLIAVTHGGTARGAMGSLLELPQKHWWRFAPLGNTCWSALVEVDRGWRLERHNTGLGPLVGIATGGHDATTRPFASPAAEPVK